MFILLLTVTVKKANKSKTQYFVHFINIYSINAKLYLL